MAAVSSAVPQSSNARALFIHRVVFRLALAAGNVLAWVVAFRMFFSATRDLELSLAATACLYVLSHLVTFFVTPLTGRALRFGVRRALILGTLVAAFSFGLLATLFLDPYTGDRMFYMLATFAILNGIYRAIYWIPYKAAETDIERHPGILIRESLVALMPALGGFVLSDNAPFILFASISASMLLSSFALARMREKYETFEWSYGETVHELFKRSNNLAVGLFILDGIQGAVLLLIWPLAAFLILGQSFVNLGAVLTATLCVAFLGRYLVRNALKKMRLHKSPSVLAVTVFSTWIARLAVGTPVQILTIDVLYNSGSSPRRFSIDSYAGEQAADGGHYVDEYTAIKEMGLCLGRMAVTLLFVVLLLTTAESLAFAAAILTAAIAAAWSVFLSHRLEKVL